MGMAKVGTGQMETDGQWTRLQTQENMQVGDCIHSGKSG